MLGCTKRLVVTCSRGRHLLTSLNPDKDRLALVTEMIVAPDASIAEATVIGSAASNPWEPDSSSIAHGKSFSPLWVTAFRDGMG